MELREQVKQALMACQGLATPRAIDRILDIPEIADALRIHRAWLASQMDDLPSERVGELIRGLKA